MGPTILVVLPARAGTHLEGILGAIGEVTTEGEEHVVQVVDTTAIGGGYRGPGRPMDVGEVEIDYSPDALDAIRSAFELTPEACIGIAMGCDRPLDHRIAAELALYLARANAGLVDFDGLLPQTPEWLDMSGRFIRADGCHMADPDFLESWMASSGFHLIK